MKDFVANHPLTDRSVYGVKKDGSKVLIGSITCVTPAEWVMYWSDARWLFLPLPEYAEQFPMSKAGTIESVEKFVRSLFEPALVG